jgi:hypothetical protein
MPRAFNSIHPSDANTFGSPKTKPKITAENLEAYDIYYDPTILRLDAGDESPVENLPSNVDGVRSFLLDFTASSVHQDRKSLMEHELTESKKMWTSEETAERDSWSLLPPTTAWWNPAFPDPDDVIRRQIVDNDIDECRRKAEEVTRDLLVAAEAG